VPKLSIEAKPVLLV